MSDNTETMSYTKKISTEEYNKQKEVYSTSHKCKVVVLLILIYLKFQKIGIQRTSCGSFYQIQHQAI
jgi:hypothetical protein